MKVIPIPSMLNFSVILLIHLFYFIKLICFELKLVLEDNYSYLVIDEKTHEG
jgi:hypothetical protein